MKEFNREEFDSLRNAVELEYKNIGNIYNPALKALIAFNSNGLFHLCYDGSRHERDKLVQRNKFRYFSQAVNIIKIATTVQEYRRAICLVSKSNKNRAHKSSLVEWFTFFSVVSFIKKIRIKVVVRRVGGESGRFHFWSVMPFWSLRGNERIISLKEIEDN